MLNLIRADFYKAIHGKVLKVCFLMMTGWIFLCAYAQKATIGMREYLVGTGSLTSRGDFSRTSRSLPSALPERFLLIIKRTF